MDASRRSELKRAYKEAVPPSGVFAIRSAVTGQTWVDSSARIDTIQNRIWFTLGLGTHPNKALQRAWNEAGADGMVFEVVERFAPDVTGFELQRTLRERKAYWIEALDAESY